MDSTQQKTTNDPTAALLKILKGETEDLHLPHKTVISAKKIRNEVLRRFVEVCEEDGHFEPKKLVDILLAFDEAVEKELVTEALFEELKKNPSLINQYFEKQDDDSSSH